MHTVISEFSHYTAVMSVLWASGLCLHVSDRVALCARACVMRITCLFIEQDISVVCVVDAQRTGVTTYDYVN